MCVSVTRCVCVSIFFFWTNERFDIHNSSVWLDFIVVDLHLNGILKKLNAIRLQGACSSCSCCEIDCCRYFYTIAALATTCCCHWMGPLHLIAHKYSFFFGLISIRPSISHTHTHTHKKSRNINRLNSRSIHHYLITLILSQTCFLFCFVLFQITSNLDELKRAKKKKKK